MKLSGFIIKNEDSQYYTAFIKEYPGIIAQGKSLEDVKAKLDLAWRNFIELARRKNHLIDYSEPTLEG